MKRASLIGCMALLLFTLAACRQATGAAGSWDTAAWDEAVWAPQ